MKTEVLKFQEDAAMAIHKQVIELRSVRGAEQSPSVILQGACGTGKSVTAARYMWEHIEQRSGNEKGTVFFVLVPGVGCLEDQLYNTFRYEFDGSSVGVYSLKNPGTVNLEPRHGMIVTANWEILTRDNNVITRDGERTNVFDFIRKIERSGMDIVLVNDEAHYGNHARTGKIKQFVNRVNREMKRRVVRVDVTATPKNPEKGTETISIDTLQAKEAGLIRGRCILNYGRGGSPSGTDGDDVLVKKELDKARTYLKKHLPEYANDIEDLLSLHLMYERYGTVSNEIQNGDELQYNPLMIVSVSNAEQGSYERKMVEDFFSRHEGVKLTEANGKLKVHTSEESMTYDELEALKHIDSPVRVLVIKQALTVGWDCPRAQFLMLTRKVSEDSRIFTMQLVGRVCRQVFATKRPDGQEASMYGYVFCNSMNSATLDAWMDNSVSYVRNDVSRKSHRTWWKKGGARKTTQMRTLRAGVSVPSGSESKAGHLSRATFDDMLQTRVFKNIKVAESLAGTFGGVTEFLDQKYVGECVMVEGASYKATVDGKSTFDALKSLIRVKLKNTFEGSGVCVSGKTAETAAEPVIEWIQAKILEENPGAEETYTPLMCAALALSNLKSEPVSGAVAVLMKKLAVLVKKREDSVDRNAYPRSVYSDWIPPDTREILESCVSIDLDEAVVAKHFYGDEIKHPRDSTYEIRFEKEVLPVLAAGKEGHLAVLLSWLRSCDSFGNNFSMGFPDKGVDGMLKGHSQQTFPDYMILVRGKNGEYIIISVEVKGPNRNFSGPHDKGMEDSIADKARIFAQQNDTSGKYGKHGIGEDKGAHLAVMIYPGRDREWYVHRPKEFGGRVKFFEWLSEHADFHP